MKNKLMLVIVAAVILGVADSSVVHRSLRHQSLTPTTRNTSDSHGIIEKAQAATFIQHQECGTAIPTTAEDMKHFGARCPAKCPLWVDDSHANIAGKNAFCEFACVGNDHVSCMLRNPSTPIADPKTGVCRRCEVTGCQKCNPDGTERCATCMEGYELKSNGRCGNTWGFVFGRCVIYLLLIVVAIVVVIVIAWIVDLCYRENVNEEGLQHALDVRSRAKIHKPRSRLLFLPESAVKSTDEPGDYEVINAVAYCQSKDEQDPSEHLAEVGKIEHGIVADGWFQRETSRKLWPLTTNLCAVDVAGPAVTLLFNFQAAIIIWALVILVTWKLVVSYTDEELLILGKLKAQTDRQNCIVVQWGNETQARLMYVKVGFLLFTYLWSFLGALFFGIRQWRMYSSWGSTRQTHQDFCAVFTGLPRIPGTVLVEEELKERIQSVTGKTVVGVSVGWEAREQYEDFETAMSFQISEVEVARGLLTARAGRGLAEISPRQEDTPGEGASEAAVQEGETRAQSMKKRVHTTALWVEGLFLHPVTQAIMTRGRQKKNLQGEKRSEEDKEKSFLGREEQSGDTQLKSCVVSLNPDLLKDAIKELYTASTAFVVFESEFSRDEAVEAIKEDGMKFSFSNASGTEETCVLRAETPDYEPQSVLWQNLSAEQAWVDKIKKFGWMLGVVILTCTFLATFEYGYSIIQINNVRSSGEEGITLSFILFTVLVASMMACLCAITAAVSSMAGFDRVGQRETCFVLLYTFSVILQVSMDAGIAYFVGKNLMSANGIRTSDGTLIEDLHTHHDFTQIFESYAMQKHIGVTILSFGFPCAFLVPFLVEPIVSIFMPYKIMALLIRSHPELKGSSAEGYMEAVPMDLGRYGDCMINVIIASMILWFPSGFNMIMFSFLLCSHCYIYLYDHYRVLRSVASIYIATYSVDFWAQWIFSIPCAIICGALTFKLNCEPYLVDRFGAVPFPETRPGFHGEPWGTHCDQGANVWIKVAIAFFGHIVIHTFCLLFIVQFCGKDDPTAVDHLYKDTAERIPCSWFSGNLIHCLRSKYVYKHDPPQDMCVIGKEHIMRLNPKIGAHFQDEKAEREEYGVPKSLGQSLARISRPQSPANEDIPSTK